MSVHSVSLKGKRDSNEDRHIIKTNLNGQNKNINNINFYGIYDGHGGKFVSKFLSNNLRNFFDQKLNSKLGIKLSYFSTHYANAYNPALGAFYIQDQFAISATPLMSAFLNLNIHNMFVALEYNNIGNFIDSKTTYFIPNYPAYPSVIRFSVLWKLSNN